MIEIDERSGLISIMGGKWTTHRAMAQDTINAVQKGLGIAETECTTRQHPLYGSAGFTGALLAELVQRYGVSDDTAQHLAAKFGTAANG